MPYGAMNLSQYWFRTYLVAWQYCNGDFKRYFGHKWKILVLVLGSWHLQQTQSNHRLHTLSSSTVNHTWNDCADNTLRPPLGHIQMWLCHIGDPNTISREIPPMTILPHGDTSHKFPQLSQCPVGLLPANISPLIGPPLKAIWPQRQPH